MKVDRIVVGVDGSHNSLVALAWAAGLARLAGAEVIAVHALGLLDRNEGDDPVPALAHRDEIRQRFETAWCAPLADAGVRSRRLLRDGPSVLVLLNVAEEEDADLLVVGSRGLGAGPERMLGSTSAQVMQEATCPVTVIPPSRS
jgi:nucleotide-binding universal stress UspA family protein